MKKRQAANSVRVVPCDSWDDFISKIRAPHFAGNRIFRGHTEASWKLSSSWERLYARERKSHREREAENGTPPDGLDGDSERTFNWYKKERDQYLERFKSHAIGLPGFDSSKLRKQTDWWALARHHGLVTPLLDWTRSPFVAAFFAFVGALEKNNPGFSAGQCRTDLTMEGKTPVVIWELFYESCPKRGRDPITIEKKSEFELFEDITDFGYRQKAQQGLFSCLTHPQHLDLESYLESRGVACLLGRYELASTEFDGAFGDLTDMNITYATVFPDLEGAAKQANIWPSYRLLFATDGDDHVPPWPVSSDPS